MDFVAADDAAENAAEKALWARGAFEIASKADECERHGQLLHIHKEHAIRREGDRVHDLVQEVRELVAGEEAPTKKKRKQKRQGPSQ